MTKVNEFIENNWDKCIKNNMTDEKRDNGDTLIGLPYPYTVPAVGHFNELYYWDTYFTNVGLIKCGRAQLAKNNTDDMLYLVDRFGFMPNGNTNYFLSRSQPPFLSAMVKDVYDYYKDKVWLTGAYTALTKEYKFWTENRTDSVGLSTYSGKLYGKNISGFAKEVQKRTGVDLSDRDELYVAKHSIGCCESGWDMNPRWDFDGPDFYHIDLNSLLYLLEKNMEFFAGELSNGEQDVWKERKEKRAQLMNKYMVNDEGLFLDFNHKTKKFGSIFSMASMYPLFAGLATKEQAEAMVKNLHRIEADFGMLVCEKNDAPGTYQWDYPNGWACHQYIAVVGLLNYGYVEDAKRIAKKYLDLVDKTFEETNNLWEKYNVIEGNVNVLDEYKMPAMMGWSAGVYLALQDIIL